MSRSFRLPTTERSARALTEKRILVVALAAVAISAAFHWSTPRSTAMPIDPACASLDKPASEAVARMVGDHSAQALLGDAVFRLRRARNHCRNGFTTLASQDYNALLNGRYSRQQ
jgi:hypothetical protein